MIQVDRHTMIQVLGCLMNKPELLSDVDKYCFDVTQFSEPLDKYIFSAIYNLYVNGAERIHVNDIDNCLQQNVYAKELLEKQNGLSFLQDCETLSDIKNFDYYYNKFKKICLVRELQLSKNDIDSVYCEDILNDNFSKINDDFEKMSPQDILNKFKGKLEVLEKKFVINSLVEESTPSQSIRDRVKEWKQQPEVGCMLQGEIFNTITRGGRKGKLYLRSGGSGIGKAVPNYTRIPTPKGWTTIGEVKTGDYLFDRFGNPTKVLAVYPQKEKKQIYKVYFKSGRIAECCNEHLWSYYNSKSRYPNKLFTSTLQELIDNPLGLQDSKGAYRFSIPICEPVQYSQKELSIDPYVFGLILGDGSFRYQNDNKTFSYSSNDEELVQAICLRMNYKKYKHHKGTYSWNFEGDYDTHKNVWVEDILKDFPELWNLKSENKFIPDDFLQSSVEQRFDLLAGLLDTDGSIDKKGRISFSTISPKLRDNIVELCESLGMTCSIFVDKRNAKYTTGECYQIRIFTIPENKIKMFKLSRKLSIAYDYLNNNKRKERRDRDSIIKIEATDVYTDMTCFYVDNEEHLFLINNFLCTHNTRSMVGDACNLAYPIRFDSITHQWVETGNCEKVLYIMTEQDPEEIDTMIIAYLTGYNEDVFTYGTFDENDPRIQVAIDIMERYSDNMNYARIPDPCASVVKNLIRRRYLQDGIENYFYDYIFSSPAMLNEYRDLGIREDVCLRLFTTALKNITVELNVFMMTSTQISNDEENKNGGFRDFRNIRGSRAIVDLVDFACIMSRPSIEELNEVMGFKQSFGYAPNLVTDIFKNRRGRWVMVRIWSYWDAGTCRKYDLFLTTPNAKAIKDFSIVDFKKVNNESYEELLTLYNTGEVTEDINFSFNEEVTPLNNSTDAFGDIYDRKLRVKDKDLSEFL